MKRLLCEEQMSLKFALENVTRQDEESGEDTDEYHFEGQYTEALPCAAVQVRCHTPC